MTPEKIGQFKSWFTSYVANFYTGDVVEDAPIRLKETHTLNVCDNAVRIAEKIGLNANECRLAGSIGLFHDVGRFRQYAEYKTFKDQHSVNHAKLSVSELARHRVLAGVDVAQRRIIARAVMFHNLAELQTGESAERALYQKIVRDADKIDIWRVFADHYIRRNQQSSHLLNRVIELNIPDTDDWSANAIDAFENQRVVHISDINSLNDLKLFQISWIYDLNFRASYQLAASRGDLRTIIDALPEAAEMQRVRDTAIRFVEVAASSCPVMGKGQMPG